MRKVFFWFGGTAVLLVIGHATAVANNPNFEHWSIKLLFVLLIVAGIGAIVTGVIWAVQLYKKGRKKRGGKTLSIEQNKSLQTQNHLEVTMVDNRIGRTVSSNRFVLLVTVKFEPSAPIQLGKLDLVYKPSLESRYITSSPLGGLPTELIERISTYGVEYEIAGFRGDFLLKIGFLEQTNRPESEWPQAYLHVLAGNLDFNTDEFPIPTPTRLLTSGKEGSQT